MAAKKKCTKSMIAKEFRGRRWSESELKEFATVLADDEHEYALTLETLALKKSANIHIFESIKLKLDARLQSISTKKGKEKAIDTSVAKLRAKYKWLIVEWRKFTDRAKSGSGKPAINKPEWFNIIDPIFSETHTQLKVATKADDILSDGDECSESNKSSEEEVDEIEENKVATCMVPREKQPLNSSASSLTSLDASNSEQSQFSGDETEEEYRRY